MSVAKSGADDGSCGTTNNDVLHKAICRVVGGGITVVAAAANDSASATHRVPASYNEVITVSALADTDGKSGALGGNRCYSWGSYDSDDTFANFSNYGFDVDLIAPGKCIWSTIGTSSYGYMSGTSMAAPHVSGAVALYKASRPQATPSQVKGYLQYLGNLNWKTSTDPDDHHEKLLSVAKIGNLGSFGFASPSSAGPIGEAGGSDSVTVTLNRSSTFFERVSFTVSEVPAGWTAKLANTSLMGWSANTTTLKVTVPPATRHDTYRIRVTGTNWGRSASILVPIVVENDSPTMSSPSVAPLSGSTVTVSSVTPTALSVRVSWTAASDASSSIAGYQVQHSVDGGTWGGTRSLGPAARSTTWSGITFGPSHSFRIRAKDEAGNWSAWKQLGSSVRYSAVSDRSSSIAYSASWKRASSSTATNGVRTTSDHKGAVARYSFTARGISVIAPRSPVRGKVAIYVDGVLEATVDTRADSVQARRIVYSQKWSSSGSHTIKLVVAGTAGRPTVSLDGFVLTR
jgi:hypothetical protein